jgi:CDP-diacylglycerol--glycerol-3-phosphate 3-phosphatidyltransferase
VSDRRAAPVVGVPPGKPDPDRPDPAAAPSPAPQSRETQTRVAPSPVAPLTPIGERVRQLTFGPSALLTPANGITVARLLATPVVVVLVAMHGVGWVPFTVAFVIGATDGIDGWLARRQGTTRSGAFLDPLADKAVVLSLLFVLAAKGEFSWLPVALIAAREVGMSLYRIVAGRRGISIPARASAKVKTLVQGIAILLALAPSLAPHRTVLTVAVWVAVAFTLVTGAQYLVDGRRAAGAARAARASAADRGAG